MQVSHYVARVRAKSNGAGQRVEILRAHELRGSGSLWVSSLSPSHTYLDNFSIQRFSNVRLTLGPVAQQYGRSLTKVNRLCFNRLQVVHPAQQPSSIRVSTDSSQPNQTGGSLPTSTTLWRYAEDT